MADQTGIMQLKGSIGNITFYKDGGVFRARSRGGHSKQRIATDPVFARTRENGLEFGAAAKGNKLFRSAFEALIPAMDRLTIGRLQKIMLSALKADATNVRGQRRIVCGTPLTVAGFDFNLHAKLGTALRVPLTTAINRTTGMASIIIPPFVASSALSAPQGATHYRLMAAAAEVDYDALTYVADTQESSYLPINDAMSAQLTMVANVTPNSTLPIYQMLALQFYQEVNGVQYKVGSGSFDAAKVIGADV